METPTFPVHPAVRDVDADGRADYAAGLSFRARANQHGSRGVALTSKEGSVMAYPIALASGRFLVAARFGRHLDAAGAETWVALGEEVSLAEAERVAARHHLERERKALAIIEIADGWEGARSEEAPPDGGMLIRRVAATDTVAFWRLDDGTVVANRKNAAGINVFWRLGLSPEEVRDLLS